MLASNFFYLVSLVYLSVTFISGDSSHEYAMVIDAGSTHSSIYVYQFARRSTTGNVAPESYPEQLTHSEDSGPIGSLTSQSATDTLISTLTSFAKTALSDDENRWSAFPIYLKATAGMRVLSTERRTEILEWIDNSFANSTINPFLFDKTYAIIASGEEEATFDWLGVNFIYNKLVNNDSDMSTYGALDLGGQSTQIAFAPEPGSNILAEFTAVRLFETTHRLYTRSHLQYGANAIEQRIAQQAYDEWFAGGENGTVNNPCLNVGVNLTYNVTDSSGNDIGEVTQYGSSMNDLSGCKRMMKLLLSNDTECYVHDCAFNGVYLAEIPKNMTFVAFSAFAYAVSNLGMNSTVDLGPYYSVALNICNLTWDQLQNSKYNNSETEKYLNEYCRTMNYVYALLHFGYGFPETNTPLIFATSYNGTSISWTQGSILRDANWLPYEVDFASDSFESEMQAWRAVGITAICIAVLGVAGIAFLVFKLKNQGSASSYNAMASQA